MKNFKIYEAPVLEFIETSEDIISTSDGIDLPGVDFPSIDLPGIVLPDTEL